ncbi:MAG: hypothetical protein D3926_17835 [Desulfobacteraceae bacterium]|nr:MAG: hypothetical protein D3926_17835 [Desulfobacteraceae bacterium]
MFDIKAPKTKEALAQFNHEFSIFIRLEDCENIADLFNTIRLLQNLARGNKILEALLRMIQSISAFLNKNKAFDRKLTLTTLTAIKEDFDSIIYSASMSDDASIKAYRHSLSLFHDLKHRIALAPYQPLLEELKSAILSLEWEINPDTTHAFSLKVNRLKMKWQSNKLYDSFLNILHALGQYTHKKKASADEEAVVLIRTVYDHLETIVTKPGLTFEQKKSLLLDDIQRYRTFKAKIQPKKTRPAAEKPIAEADIPELKPALSQFSSQTDSASMEVDELVSLSDEQLVAQEIEDKNLKSAPIQPPSKPKTDVMDDLFNPKASPVDDLLDKIHLMNVLGKDKAAAPGMMESQEAGFEEQGMKSYAPGKKDQQPIEEITNRIDDFFDIGSSAAPAKKKTPPAPDRNKIPKGPIGPLVHAVNRASRELNLPNVNEISIKLSQLKTALKKDPNIRIADKPGEFNSLIDAIDSLVNTMIQGMK